MGTALTGLEIRDTYDALIKVTDNGPLSGTLKALSDGLGNDSTLSLSTTAASIAGTLAVTGASTFNGLPTVNIAADNTTVGIFHTGGGTANKGLKISTFASVNDNAGVTLDAQTSTGVLAFATVSTERMRITSAGLVGIGTSAPIMSLEVIKNSTATLVGNIYYSSRFLQDSTSARGILLGYDSTSQVAVIGAETNGPASSVAFYTYSAPVWAERFRVTANGVTFNGDTAAANALDDYEEGTFTPTIEFGGASVGITYFDRQGNYTKIGRQVTCTMYIALTAVGSSTGNATITGLPFTCANLNRGTVGAPSLRFANITFSGQLTGSVPNNNTIIELSNTTLLGVQTSLTNANFNSASEFNAITVTYFTA